MSTDHHQAPSVHPTALNESRKIGAGTTIGAFARIAGTAELGPGCSIGAYAVVADDVILGPRVTLESGVVLSSGTTLEADVSVGPHATFIGAAPGVDGAPVRTVVRRGAAIGANATILGGIQVGIESVVAPGAVVMREVPPHAIVQGNPAVIKSYTRTDVGASAGPPRSVPPAARGTPPTVESVALVPLPQISDLRGSLSFAEVGQGLPFVPQRYFTVYDVPTPEIRGEHAHRLLHEFLVPLRGSFHIAADDGTKRWETVLDSPRVGLHVKPKTWITLFGFSADCILLVLASDVYVDADYIRTYDEFLALAASHPK